MGEARVPPTSAAWGAGVKPPALRDLLFPLGLMTAGAFLQVAWNGYVGYFLLIWGWFMYLSLVDTTGDLLDFSPKFEEKGKERWVTVTSAEIDRLQKKLVIAGGPSEGCVRGCLSGVWWVVRKLLTFMLVIGLAAVGVEIVRTAGGTYDEQEALAAVLVLDVFTLLFLYWFSNFVGGPTTWTPDLPAFKLPHFEAFKKTLAAAGIGDWAAEYQLQLTPSDRGDMPTDIKMQLRPPQAPREFIGVQAQISINRGGPYLYFVVITKSGFDQVKPVGGSEDVVDLQKNAEVNILVVRQTATKTGGYQTTSSDVSRLLTLVRASVRGTLEKRAKT